jgi:hypothetical protein
MLDLLIVVGLLVMVCVRDNPLVVGWLCSGHSVPGGLGFWTVPCWVCAVLAMKQTVESVRLLRPSSASPSGAVVTALGGIPDDERSLQLSADWLCCAPIGDCGCPGRSLAAVAWSRFCWTADGP